MSIHDLGELQTSRAKAPAEPVGILNFELPPVTQSSGDFVRDDGDQVPGDSVEFSEVDEAEKLRGTPDSKGNPYDPSIHAFPPEMTGKLKKWKKKPKIKQEKDIAEGQQVNTAFRGEADKIARLYAQLHMLPFGRDGGLENVEDLNPLTDDLERYLMEVGHTHISPKYAVGISAILYSVGVCQRPSNAERVKAWFGGLGEKVKGWFGIKPKSAPRKPAPKPAPEPEPEQKSTHGYQGSGFQDGF